MIFAPHRSRASSPPLPLRLLHPLCLPSPGSRSRSGGTWAGVLALATLVALLALLAGAAAARTPLAGDPKVRPGYWNKGKVPKGWVVVESENYHVQCQAGEEKARLLADHLESIRGCYEEFLPNRRKDETFVLKVFATRKAFADYCGTKPDAAPRAYYDKATKELVGYDTGVILGKRDVPAQIALRPEAAFSPTAAEQERLTALFEAITDAWTMDTARILSHEGWHQYFHNYTVSWVAMPSWLDEGVGDYFFMAWRDEQNSDAEHGYRIGDINTHRLRAIRRGLFEGSAVSFSTLLGYEQQQYYSNPGVFYAQGWSMVHFLLQHEQPEYRELIPRLIKDFKDTKNFRKSTEKAFRKFDVEQIDQEWLGWLLSHQISDPLMDLAREFGERIPANDLEAEEVLINVYTWYLEHPEFGSEAAAPPTAPAAQ